MQSPKRNVERISYMILVLLAVSLAFPFQFEVKGAVLTAPVLLILILSGLTLYRILILKERPGFSGIHLIPFLVFLLFSIPSRIPHLQIKGWLQGSWHLFRNLVELLPLMYILIVLNLKKRNLIRSLALVLLIAVSLSSAIGIIQTASDGRIFTGIGVYGNLKYMGIYPPFPSDSQPLARLKLGQASVITHTLYTNMFRAHGGLSTHNYLGAFLILTIALTLSVALTTRKPLLLLLTALQLAALAVTFTRAAWVAGFVFIVIIVVLRKGPGRDLLYLLLILILAGTSLTIIRPSITQAVFARGLTIIKTPADPPVEVEARTQIWASGIKAIKEQPEALLLGRGEGGIDQHQILGVSLTAHNDVIDTLYTRGLIALIGLVVFYFLVLRDAYRLFRKEEDDVSQALALGVFAGLIGVCLVGISQTIHNVPEVAGLLWFVIGLFIAYKRAPAEDRE